MPDQNLGILNNKLIFINILWKFKSFRVKALLKASKISNYFMTIELYVKERVLNKTKTKF